MTPEQAIQDAIDRIREADDEAYRAQLAFATGRFGEYWAEKAVAIGRRLEAEYERAGEQPEREHR